MKILPKGYRHTEEWKRKASERMKGNKSSLGYKQTAEHVEKSSNGRMKKDLSHIDLTHDEIIDGLLLSDAHITYPDSDYANVEFQLDLTIDSEEMVDYVEKYLNNFGFTTWHKRLTRKTNYTKEPTTHKRFHTHRFPTFTKLRKRWYKGRDKIIPLDLKLTPETLAFWHMGDGSARYYSRGILKGEIILETQCFTKSEVDFLRKKLSEIGLKKSRTVFRKKQCIKPKCNNKAKKGRTVCNKHLDYDYKIIPEKDQEGYAIVMKTSKYVSRFMELVEQYMLDCFSYKVFPVYVNSKSGQIPKWEWLDPEKICLYPNCQKKTGKFHVLCNAHVKYEPKCRYVEDGGTYLKCKKRGCTQTTLKDRTVCNDHKGLDAITPSHYGPLPLWKTDPSRQQCIAKGCKGTAEKGREVCHDHRGVSPIKQNNRGHIQAWRIDSSRKKCKVSDCKNTAKIGRDVCKNHI